MPNSEIWGFGVHAGSNLTMAADVVTLQTAAEWRVVFYLGGFIYAFGAVFFLLFGTGNKQQWAQDYSELLADEDHEEQ